MGKHTNTQQEDFMIDFMEKHPQLAKGFVKGDRVEMEKLWQNFAKELNKIGPPLKDCNGWKKIWSDKKSSIKKKIATNKKESQATGGGPYNQLYISSREEAIGKLCGLYDVVNGVEGSLSFGFQPVDDNTTSAEMNIENDADKAIDCDILKPSSSQAHKRRRDTTFLQDDLKQFMCSEKKTNENIKKSLMEISESIKTNVDVSTNFEYNTKRIYRAVDKLADRIKELTEATNRETNEIKNQTAEIQRHNKEIEKLLYEKNMIKKKTLELQKEQLEIYKL